MSYHVSHKRRPGKKFAPTVTTRAGTMGTWPFDSIADVLVGPIAALDLSLLTTSSPTACLDQANAATTGLDAQIASIAQTWNPSGFYTSAQLRQVVNQVLQLQASAYAQVSAAPNSTSDAATAILQASDDLNKVGASALDFTTAADAADAQGIKVINSPGLKQWVINSMNACSNALVTAYVMNCSMPELATALGSFMLVFNLAANVIVAIVGTVVAAGDAVLHLAVAATQLSTYLMAGTLAAGALYLYWKFGKGARPAASAPRLSARRTKRRPARRSTRRRSNRRSRR